MKMMLVEDDDVLRESLKETLELECYDIIALENMSKALQLFDKTIDLMIIDIQLPDGNGIDLCKKIRLISQVPILFLTANDNEDMLVKGLESGGDDYMTKPFRVKELYARISSLLRRSYNTMDNVKIGDLIISLNRYEIKKNNQIIQLSSIDYEIFFMLVRYRNQVLTRNQLLETIEKDGQYFVEDNTLSVHMRRIREKLGTYYNHSYIETVRGIGYRINQEVLNGNE